MATPTGWVDPKTDWATDDGIGTADLNRIEENTRVAELGNRTPDDTIQTYSGTASLRVLLDNFAYMFRLLGGRSYWYNSQPYSGFCISGCVGGEEDLANTDASEIRQKVKFSLSPHCSLVLTRLNFSINSALEKIQVYVDGYSGDMYQSWSNSGNLTPEQILYSNDTNIDVSITIIVAIDGITSFGAKSYDSWTCYFREEPYETTTTTTTTPAP
jgi:hypothetical protein